MNLYQDKKHSINQKKAAIFATPYTLLRAEEYTTNNILERQQHIIKARTYIQDIEQ
jgi:hypothetical protein